MSKTVTDKTFKTEVLESELPVMVDFWASWCPPCKMTEPTVAELSEELEGKVKVCKINVDQNPQMRSDYNIMGVPTFILFKKGKELKRAVGARSKQQLLNMLEDAGISVTG